MSSAPHYRRLLQLHFRLVPVPICIKFQSLQRELSHRSCNYLNYSLITDAKSQPELNSYSKSQSRAPLCIFLKEFFNIFNVAPPSSIVSPPLPLPILPVVSVLGDLVGTNRGNGVGFSEPSLSKLDRCCNHALTKFLAVYNRKSV